MEQLVIPFSIENPDDCSDADICRAYNAIIDRGFRRKDYEHLGRRSKRPRYLKQEIPAGSCLDWFRQKYPPEQWSELLASARTHALDEAAQQTKRRADLSSVRGDMERKLSARQASARLFGLSDSDIEKLRRDQAEILGALSNPVFRIESAAMIWMVKGSLKDENVC